MIGRMISVAMLGGALAASAASHAPSFAGNWTMDPQQSRNLGMMAAMKIHTVVGQTTNRLTVDDTSDFNGQSDTQHTIYDLTGAAVHNHPIMSGTATTRSHWEGNRLVTEWKSPGSIAGTTVQRTEVRYLSPDGRTMFVESSRAGQQPMVMVFRRDR